SSDRVLPYLNSIYAPEVTYYGKLLSKQAVLRDKYYFLKHWPIRQTWQAGNPTISCTRAECEITGVRRYNAINADRHASGWVSKAVAVDRVACARPDGVHLGYRNPISLS
ncbi:MAG TPA: hypothetical protein VE687_08040, partial [Stellaceae bacterium]|nr:hypothetical protein [Stellaceae bacterium]